MDSTNTICITIKKKSSEHIYNWVLENFSCAFNTFGTNLPSVKFEFNSWNNMHFIGSLSLQGDSCESRKFIIELNCTTHALWTVKYRIIICENDSSSPFKYLDSNYKRNEHKLCNDRGDICFLKKTSPPTIKCLIIVEAYESTSNAMFPITESKTEKSKFWQIFETKKYSDVSFQVRDEEIDAHKLILGCSSPVFEAMFEHQMAESLTNKVVIEDMEPAVFEEMLRFIYCDEVPNLKIYADKLLQASDKYDLPILKNRCEKELADNIVIENAAETFMLANLYRADELKKWALNFIKNNRQAVMQTQAFSEFLKTHSGLVAELLMDMIN